MLQDGSYASQSFVDSTESAELAVLSLRHLLLLPSYFAFSALCASLATLCAQAAKKEMTLRCLLLMSGVLSELDAGIDELNRARVAFCINALLDPALTGVAAQLKATNEESGCDVRR